MMDVCLAGCLIAIAFCVGFSFGMAFRGWLDTVEIDDTGELS